MLTFKAEGGHRDYWSHQLNISHRHNTGWSKMLTLVWGSSFQGLLTKDQCYVDRMDVFWSAAFFRRFKISLKNGVAFSNQQNTRKKKAQTC